MGLLMSQVVCRMQKLKSSGEVGAVGAHNSRTQTDGYRHVDPKAPKPISLKGGGDLVAEVSARIGDRKIRKVRCSPTSSPGQCFPATTAAM